MLWSVSSLTATEQTPSIYVLLISYMGWDSDTVGLML